MRSPRPFTAPSASALDDARRHLQRCVDRSQIAGAVALVAHGDELIRLDCVGQRDIEAGLPMQPDTIFRIASMTKPITSVAALGLIEAGRLRLDDAVARYIPAFADAQVFDGVDDGEARLVPLERPITIRDLLTHTSGLSGEAPHPSLTGVYDDLEVGEQPMSEIARRLAGHPLAHQPGASWIYGWSHGVLGHVIERITDRPLDVHLAETIFEPLGMVDTGYHVPAGKLDRVAVVYDQVEGGLRPRFDAETDVRRPPVLLSGGTGCVSTVHDYGRFLQMLELGGELDGVRLLSPGTVAAMTRNQLEPSLVPITIDDHVFADEGFGLGVGVVVGPGSTSPVGAPGTWTWAGAWGTTFCVDPIAGLTFVFMTQYEPWAWFREGAEYWSIVRGPVQD